MRTYDQLLDDVTRQAVRELPTQYLYPLASALRRHAPKDDSRLRATR